MTIVERVVAPLKRWAKRHWPRLRLRTILLMTLLLVAALPGVGAISLRVYENTLVRQTEAELVAQGAALAATAEALWPSATNTPTANAPATGPYRANSASMDLSASPILPERAPALPAPDARADPSAMAVARTLVPVMARTARTTLASIQLIDRDGLVINGHERGRSHARLAEFRRAMAGDAVTVFRRNGGYRPRYSFEWLSRASGLRIHHARPVVVAGRPVSVLLLSRSPRALFKGLYQDRGKIGLGIAAIFVALLGITALLSRGIARPIEQLGAATRGLASGAGEIPEPPATAAIEIRALYEDFASMAAAVARRGRYLRDFAAAVSHEFKTPLSGIRGGIEILSDHGDAMSADERARFLRNVSADADRLAQLVTRLLDLARADMAEPQAGVASDPAAAVRRVADAWNAPGFAIDAELGATRPVAVPAPTLETALTALVENSRQAGALRVRIEAVAARAAGQAVESGMLVLVVSDDGPGVPAGDAARLFEPFFTSRRAAGGTGLGLPIARSLLHASGAELELCESENGAVFALRLPIA